MAGLLAGLVGWPVAHSLSPALHRAWIAAAGLDADYVAFAVDPRHAPQAIAATPAFGLRGVNVTLPYKELALSLAGDASPTARRLGAANVLLVGPDGRLHADNTDGVGFLAALEGLPRDRSRPALILGAGGAARAAAFALIEDGAREIRVANRDAARAKRLAADVRGAGARAIAADWAERASAVLTADVGLLVNATPLGMNDQPQLDFDLANLPREAVVYDLLYRPRPTALVARARAAGLAALDGLAMLIAQARPSFELFFGRPPPEGVDLEAILAAKLGESAPA